MEYLGETDKAQLYNFEKRELIRNRMDADTRSMKTMRQFMKEEDIDRFGEICKKLLYKAIVELKEKYYGFHEECHSFIGINPPPGTITMQELWNKTKQLEGRYKWLPPADMAYVVEQNVYDKSGNLIKRPHVHLMVRGLIQQKPGYIAEKISKHFDISQPSIDVKKYSNNRAYVEHLNYIKGEKKDGKMELVELDIADRETLGIPDIKLFSNVML